MEQYTPKEILSFDLVRDTLPVQQERIISRWNNGDKRGAYDAYKEYLQLKHSSGGKDYAQAIDIMATHPNASEEQKARAKQRSFDAIEASFKDIGFDPNAFNDPFHRDTLQVMYPGLAESDLDFLTIAADQNANELDRLVSRRAGEYLRNNCSKYSTTNPDGGLEANQILADYKSKFYKATDIAFGGLGKKPEDLTTAEVDALTSLTGYMASNKLGETNARRYFNASKSNAEGADNSLEARVGRIKAFDDKIKMLKAVQIGDTANPQNAENAMHLEAGLSLLAETDAGLNKILTIGDSGESIINFENQLIRSVDEMGTMSQIASRFAPSASIADFGNYYLHKHGIPSSFDGVESMDANSDAAKKHKEIATAIDLSKRLAVVNRGMSYREPRSFGTPVYGATPQAASTQATTKKPQQIAKSKAQAQAEKDSADQALYESAEAIPQMIQYAARQPALIGSFTANQFGDAISLARDFADSVNEANRVGIAMAKSMPMSQTYNVSGEEQNVLIHGDSKTQRILSNCIVENNGVKTIDKEKFKEEYDKDPRNTLLAFQSSGLYKDNEDIKNGIDRLLAFQRPNVSEEAAKNNAAEFLRRKDVRDQRYKFENGTNDAIRNFTRGKGKGFDELGNLKQTLSRDKCTLTLDNGAKLTSFDLFRMTGVLPPMLANIEGLNNARGKVADKDKLNYAADSNNPIVNNVINDLAEKEKALDDYILEHPTRNETGAKGRATLIADPERERLSREVEEARKRRDEASYATLHFVGPDSEYYRLSPQWAFDNLVKLGVIEKDENGNMNYYPERLAAHLDKNGALITEGGAALDAFADSVSTAHAALLADPNTAAYIENVDKYEKARSKTNKYASNIRRNPLVRGLIGRSIKDLNPQQLYELQKGIEAELQYAEDPNELKALLNQYSAVNDEIGRFQDGLIFADYDED